MDRPIASHPHKKFKKRLVMVVCAVFALVFLFYVFSIDVSTKRVEKDKIRFATVQRGHMDVVVTGNGNVMAKDPQWLTAKSEGIVAEIFLQAGDHAKPGDAILLLRNLDIDSQLLNASARLAGAKAALASQRVNLRSQRTSYEAALSKAQLDHNYSVKFFEMQNQLMGLENSPISQIEYLQTEIKKDQAFGLLQSAKKNLKAFDELESAQLDEFNYKVQAIQLELDNLQQKQSGLLIKSDREGVVQDFDLKIGERVNIGQVMAKIVDTNDFFVRMRVPAVMADKLARDQRVVISANKKEYEAVLFRVDPNVKGTTVEVDIDFSNINATDLRIGMFLSGEIYVQSLQDTLFIDRPAGAKEEGVMPMFKRDERDNYLQKVRITTGVMSSNKMQIKSGLETGDVVVISDLKDSMQYETLRLH